MKSVTTVLFVENDVVALTMYQKRLQREGFHVEGAEDGIAALRVLSEMTPDIVVLDLMLPKFSGRDVFDYMRADAQFKKVPIIIFSNAPKTEWPHDTEASPTRALPKSEANFAMLLEHIREMTTAAEAAAAAPASVPEPALVLQTNSNTATASEAAPTPSDPTATESAGQFLEFAIADMPAVREQCLAFIKAPATDAGRQNLSSLRQRLNGLSIGAQKTGCARLGLLTGAWEGLVADIERKPAIISPSILQTLAQAADCLRILLNADNIGSMEPLPQARALSVDDDEICNQVAVSALQRANIAADSVMDASAALELLKQNNYDVILLDINMPGLTGFELCERLRALPHHQKTPVIFVTAFNNFENRKQSVLSGGGDLIAKPVAPLELALKVTIHLLKAPPKPVIAPMGQAQPEPPMVWKEPTETISQDTEMLIKASKNGNGAPDLVAPTTETRTGEPEPARIDVPAPAAERKVEPVTPEPKLKPAAAIPAGTLAGLKMKADEPKPVQSKPTEIKPVQPKPVEAKAPEAKPPVQAKAPEPKPVEAKTPVQPPPIPKPAEVKPVEPKPVEAKAPVQPKPVEPKPAEMKPVEVKAAEPKAAEPKAAEPKAVESKPVQTKAAEPKASEPKAIESKPVQPKAPEPKPVEVKAAEPKPAQTKPVEPAEVKPAAPKISESAAKSLPLADEGKVTHTQPPRTTEPAAPATKGGSKEKKHMSKENNPQFETLVLDVAHIIFGDNAPDINVRLVRMALEQVWTNRAALQSVDAIAKEIARIIFGEANSSELNVRLVKMALERSNSIALFKAA